MKNPHAQELGKQSWKSRTKGKTKSERSQMMRELRQKALNLTKEQKERV